MDIANELKKELSWRDILKDIANEEDLSNIIKLKSKFYVGVDPTASSLHLGHYISIIVSKLIQQTTKMNPVFVMGGLTSQIGDPSGKDVERVLIDKSIIEKNVKLISKQITELAKKLDIKDFEIFDNMNVYKNMSIVDLFQKFGKFFNLNSMLSKEMVKVRLETGISYTEFSYQLFQAIDFYTLFKEKNVRMQIGGSDQWGNIVSGIELIRKLEGIENSASGITMKLLLDENGNKIGKTGGNAIWLNREMFSSFQFYQYLINTSDFLASNLLKRLTLIKKDEYEKIIEKSKKNPKSRIVQKELGKRILNSIHDEKAFEEVERLSEILFTEKYEDLTIDDFKEVEIHFGKNQIFEYKEIEINDFLLNEKILNSRREFREFYAVKAIKINGVPLKEEEQKIEKEFLLKDKYIVLNVGKKRKYLIIKK